MEILQNNIDELNATIKITVTKSDYQDAVENSLKNIRKNTQMKGFRQGQAPMGLIKKMYFLPVMIEEIQKVVSKSLFNYLRDNKVKYLGNPIQSYKEGEETDIEKDETFNYYFDIAFAPQFDFSIDSNLALTQYVINVSDEDIEKTTTYYRNLAGKNEPAEISSDNSMLKGIVYQVNEDGSRIENGLSNTTSMLVNRVENEEKKAAFIDKKKGDVVNFNIKEVFKEAEAKIVLGNELLDFNTVNPNFAFQIEEINDFVKGELNQEMFDRFFGKDKVHNEDEMKEVIRSQYESEYAEESNLKLFTDAKEAFLNNATFKVPVEFMKRWLLSLKEYQDYDEAKLDAQFPNLEQDIKWHLIQDKIVKTYNIEITADDELEESKKLTIAEFSRYGVSMSQLPAEMLDNYSKERLAQTSERNMLRIQAISKKIVEVVKQNASITQQNISSQEFGKILEQLKQKD